jgi:hypothetical protein
MIGFVKFFCILRESQNAISADSANTALELVDAADSKLATAFGDNNTISKANSSTPVN